MSRLPTLSTDTLTEEQKRVHDLIAKGPRGRVGGPFLAWLQAPQLAERAQALGEYCRFHSSLPPRLSELAILVTAVFWHAGYVWNAHAPLALKGGLAETVIEAIRTGAAPPFAREDEHATHAFVSELLSAHEVSETTWKRALAALGSVGVVDLVGILGYYALISMTIKSFEVPLPPEATDPFAPARR